MFEEAELPGEWWRNAWRGSFASESKQSCWKWHICQREVKHNCFKRQNCRVNEEELLEEADLAERVSRVAWRGTFAREKLSITVWRCRIAVWMKKNFREIKCRIVWEAELPERVQAEVLEEADLPERIKQIGLKKQYCRIAWRGGVAWENKQNCFKRQNCRREFEHNCWEY